MTLLSVARRELVSFPAIVFIGIIGILYVLLALSLLNYQLVTETILGPFGISYKITLLLDLLQGAWTAMSHTDFSLFILNALLVGTNIVLMVRTLSLLNNKLHFSIGGATLIGLVTTGCTSCGFSLLSVLGLSASLSFLPFRGL